VRAFQEGRFRDALVTIDLSFAVVVDGEVVGQQNITGADFKSLRTVNSFSFLARAHQGRGLGKEMRSAILHLAFAGLGASRADSDAFHDNLASVGLSRSLGYQENGTMLARVRAEQL
jgi:RimJ/RimL family protein N-acetyltransferase